MADKLSISSYEELIESVDDCFRRLDLFAFSHRILKEEGKFSDASYVKLFLYEIMRLKRKALCYFNTVSLNRAEDVANFNSTLTEYANAYKNVYGTKGTADFIYEFPDNVAEPLV